MFRLQNISTLFKKIGFNFSKEIFYKSQNGKLRLLLLLTIIILFPQENCYAQNQLTGKVFSAKDSTAIFGASVYFDGTSIGVSTNNQGYYKIPFKENNSSLVISSLGYDPVIINTNGYTSITLPNIYLKEKLEELNTVHLETDPWTRLRKLRVFKKEFLGSNKPALSCKIINEDSIELRYIPSSKTLVASSDEPLIIENKYLGYVIRYNLTDFEVKFKTSSGGLTLPFSTYYEGFSFFEPLRKKLSKKITKNRKLSYLGSSLHFMRSLYEKNLDEDNFKIFYERFHVPTYKYFDISQNQSIKMVELMVDEIAILYNDFHQSGLKTKSKFTIDYFGNHSPPESIILKGDMSKERISELLPLNYKL